MRSLISFLTLCLTALWFAAAAALAQTPGVDAPQATLETSPLVILQGETSHEFTVELADDPEEISIGLMFRETMGADEGMLFNMGVPRPVSFWMKNTILPLDLLFMDESGAVVAIAENAVPFSERRIDPGMAVKAVLELNAGVVGELGLAPGATVQHPIFSAEAE